LAVVAGRRIPLLQCVVLIFASGIIALLCSLLVNGGSPLIWLYATRDALAVAFCAQTVTLLLNRLYVRTKCEEEVAETQQTRERAAQMESRIVEISRATRIFIDSMNVDHEYEEFTVEYIIDEGRYDRWFRRYVIGAGAEPIRVLKGFSISAQGSLAEKVKGFRDLDISIKTDSGAAVFLPFFDAPEGTHALEGAVLFCPRVEAGHVKHLEIGGCWEGLWNDLRQSGRDEGRLSISKPARWLRISVTFPRSWTLQLVPVSFPKFDHHEILATAATDASQQRITWVIEGASTGTYVYEIIRAPSET
jgi:hypothetical protein